MSTLTTPKKSNAHLEAERAAKARLQEEFGDEFNGQPKKRMPVARIAARLESIGKKFIADDGDTISKTVSKSKTRNIVLAFRVPTYDKVAGHTTYENKSYNEVLPFRTDRCKANEDGFTSKDVIDTIKTMRHALADKISVTYLSEEDLHIEEEMAKDDKLRRDISLRQANIESQDPLGKAYQDPYRAQEQLATLPPILGIPSPSGPLPGNVFNTEDGIPAHLAGLETDMV